MTEKTGITRTFPPNAWLAEAAGGRACDADRMFCKHELTDAYCFSRHSYSAGVTLRPRT